MNTFVFSYAVPEETISIFKLFYNAFHSKFHTMLPESPEKAFYLYSQYFNSGLQKKRDKIIVAKNKGKIIGFLALEGLGIPFLSGNPGLTAVGKTIRLVGFRKFLRLFLGMFLIEGYPPSTDFLYINTIIVRKKFRGQGVGKSLIALACAIAEKRNFKGLSLYVDATNIRALKFYNKLQFIKASGFGGEFMRKIIGVKYFIYQYKVIK